MSNSMLTCTGNKWKSNNKNYKGWPWEPVSAGRSQQAERSELWSSVGWVPASGNHHFIKMIFIKKQHTKLQKEQRIKRILIKSTSLHLYIFCIWDPTRARGQSCKDDSFHRRAIKKQEPPRPCDRRQPYLRPRATPQAGPSGLSSATAYTAPPVNT